ncbi:DUF2894 domain-containing protein [Lysobacter capsici]|uniref:DUF2894 domain-containing protein n=1 Tax=Lysobacter capsici TaxID=435897 RepID=UPI00287BAF16|nr:DUF2894 domain-containing protein [Lysobacter capsici]WND81333.1 DUF2894 domain-containing protein [Lysobacter capsici]WND86529.1 DUF2894 domain-containing protein [Lysobacter capsici]
MRNNQVNARTVLDAWREQGADRMSRVRFHRLDALERRAASHDGEVRRLLDARLAELIAAYAADLEAAAPSLAARADDAATDAPASDAMSGLIGYIAEQAALRDQMATDEATPRAAFPELAALDDFRQLWSAVRVENQTRVSLEQVLTDAGPLNSGALVHRSLTLMRELSPGYLQHFMAYVDALTWLERMSDDGVLAPDDSSQAAANGKRTRDKPRKRRE